MKVKKSLVRIFCCILVLNGLFYLSPVTSNGQTPQPVIVRPTELYRSDYDGDGRADLSCHSTSTGIWRIDYASNGYGVWDVNLGGYGLSENRETTADYDGDGRADISVHSITQGKWNIDYASNGFGTWNQSFGGYGGSVNREVPADYDGDGRADISVRSDTGQNWVIDFASGGFGSFDQVVFLVGTI